MKNNPDILVATSFTHDDIYEQVGMTTVPLMMSLCMFNGCNFVCNRKRLCDRPPHWDKVALVRYMLPLYKAVLWLDIDSVIVRLFDIDDLYRLPGNFICRWDENRNNFNSGVFLVKNTESMRRMLDTVWSMEDSEDGVYQDQAAFNKVHASGVMNGDVAFMDPKYNTWRRTDDAYIYHLAGERRKREYLNGTSEDNPS